MQNNKTYLAENPLNYSSLTSQLYTETKYTLVYSMMKANLETKVSIEEAHFKEAENFRLYVLT